jgi:putative endonuclease
MSTPANNRAPALAAAISYLEGIGFQVRDHDWSQAGGSLDIVAADRGTLVICVLKVAGRRYGRQLETVGQASRRRLRRLAALWLSAHGTRFDQVRIDVVGVLRDGTGGFTIEHARAVG